MLWKKPYTLRRYQPQTTVNGYATEGYSDSEVMLDVQPLSSSGEILAEGDRGIYKLKTFGRDMLRIANQFDGTRADRLFFNGCWYECKASDWYGNTSLAHCEAQFDRVSEAERDYYKEEA